MNHTAILKAFVTRLSSEDLAECSRMAAQAEQASTNGSTDEKIAADQDMIRAIDDALGQISDSDRSEITRIIEREAGDTEDKFQRFKATRKLYNLHDLVGQGNEAAASFMECQCAPSSTQVYAYHDGAGTPSLFIEVVDNHQVSLLIANTEEQAEFANIERLERILFEWATAEGYFE